MDVLRDMAIGIAVDADSNPFAEIRREMATVQREARGLGREVSGLGSTFVNSHRGMIDESQAFVKQAGRQSDLIRQLARTSGASATQLAHNWSDMSKEMKQSLIRNHNDMRKYRQQLMGVEGDMWKLSNQMGHYTGATNDFMDEVNKLGKDHKKISEQMINSNVALRQSYVQQAATVMNLSTTSSKITKVYDDTSNALYKVNKPLLAVTDGMERLTKQGNPVVVALKQLGPNASMKELQDRINLINTGIMRQQMLLMVMGAAWIGFTAIVARAAMGPDVEKNLQAQSQAWADYRQAVDQRTQEIANTFGLFEQVQIQATSPRRLYLNLQQQLKVMQGWQSNLAALAQKGLDEGFIAELRKMGPSAAGEIAALTQMSDKGLNEYVAMWKDKHQLARTAAITELEQLRRDTAVKVQELKDSLKPLGIAVEEFKSTWATALAPFVEFWGQMASYVVNAGTKIGGFVQRLNEINPWITKLAGMFLYLFTTMTVILSPLAIGIGLLGGMRASFTALFMIIKPFVLGFASVAGTAAVVSLALIGVGAALYLLWTRSETFRNAVISGWESIKQTAISVWGTIKPYIMDAIGAVVTFGQQKLAQLKTFWEENGAQIWQAVQNVWTPIGAVIKTVLGVVWSVMKFVWPAVLFMIKSVWGNIKGIINGALNVIMGVVKVFTGLFTGDFGKMWEGVKQVFFGAIQFIWNFIQLNMFGKILTAGKAFVVTFKNVGVSLWTGLKNIFIGGINAVKNFVVNGFKFLRTTSDNIFTGLKNSALGIWNTLRGGLSGLITRIINGIKNAWTSARTNTVNMFNNIRDAVTTRFTSIVDGAKALPKRIGDGIKGMAKHAMGGIKHLANTMVAGLAQGVNGVSGGINWVFEKIGVDTRIPEWTPPKYAKGTNYHPGGPAIVGDGGGPELMRTPSGQVALSPGKATMVNLPRGTEVLPHRQTAALMNAPAYAKGSKGEGVLASMWSNTKNTASGFVEGIKKAGSTVKDLAVDVFSYLGNPSGLMSKVWDGLGAIFPKMNGAFGEMGIGALKMIKDKAINYVSGLLPSMSSGGIGWGDPFVRTSGFGMRFHPIDKVWKMHNGIDYAAPSGTPIPSQTGGRVSFSGWQNGYGNTIIVDAGAGYQHLYGHNSRNSVSAGQMVSAGSILGLVGSTGKSYGPHVHYEVRKNGKAVNPDNVPAAGGMAPNVSGGAAAWRPMILQAAARMKEAVTPAQVQGIIAQIDRESSGNQRIFQSSAVNDINMRNGNPARGLLQYIPSTFRSYMVKGHTDILNGMHQLLAFFNNTNWRKDLPYGRRGWGPTGARKYARGTNYHPGGPAIVGDGNGPEWIKPPKGPGFLSPGFPTGMLLPRGSSVTSHEKTMRALNGASKQREETYNPKPDNTGTVSKNTTVTFSPEINVTVEGGGSDASVLKQQLKEIIRQQLQEQWDENFMRLLIQFGLIEEEV